MIATGLPKDPFLLGIGALVREFISPDGFRIDLLCEALGLRAADLAQMTGRETTSVARYVKTDRVTNPDDKRTTQVLKELVQVVGLLRAMKMDDNAASWLRTPLPSYEGRTPLEVIEGGRGQELVQQLLALAAGETGG